MCINALIPTYIRACYRMWGSCTHIPTYSCMCLHVDGRMAEAKTWVSLKNFCSPPRSLWGIWAKGRREAMTKRWSYRVREGANEGGCRRTELWGRDRQCRVHGGSICRKMNATVNSIFGSVWCAGLRLGLCVNLLPEKSWHTWQNQKYFLPTVTFNL